jgi:hypothetical protein
MTIEEMRKEIKDNPDGDICMAYRIGYSQGLKDKSMELSPVIEKLFDAA